MYDSIDKVMAIERFGANSTTGIPSQQPQHTEDTGEELAIGTILAIALFIIIIGFYVWKLQSPSYRRRFGRHSESSRRTIGRTSGRGRMDMTLDTFEPPFKLPRYESVVLDGHPPPYDLPPSYEEATSCLSTDVEISINE